MPMNPVISEFSSWRMGLVLLACVVAFAVLGASQAQAPPESIGRQEVPKWTTFTSRGGWSIRYPPELHVSSCRQCDPTEPEVIVAFSGSSGQVVVMIEPLADRRDGLSAIQWLTELAHDTVSSPAVSERRTFIDGAPSVIVMNGAAGSNMTENIYVENGVKTVAIRFPHTADTSILSTCEQMLSTFRFLSRGSH